MVMRSNLNLNRLRKFYAVKHKIVSVWDYGDGSHRKRVFVVGFSKELGDAADWFEFPEAEYGELHEHCA